MISTLATPEVRKNSAKTEGAAKTSRNVTPKLTCIVTGAARLTNAKYIASKPEGFVSNYISRAALKLLRQGKSLSEVRTALNVDSSVPTVNDSKLQAAIKINGKWSSKA
ncbi:hypothetical protein EBR43_08870 [bacterium]|nr:hypothetical protein [bacterium]